MLMSLFLSLWLLVHSKHFGEHLCLHKYPHSLHTLRHLSPFSSPDLLGINLPIFFFPILSHLPTIYWPQVRVEQWLSGVIGDVWKYFWLLYLGGAYSSGIQWKEAKDSVTHVTMHRIVVPLAPRMGQQGIIKFKVSGVLRQRP
jgi:hypothetical protein